ncbi:hypothetical protein CGCSCA4_v013053 [Colletotrichum siamense]|uniref:Uncharacterized protein n=1 Tax=Colletotrichum siamense TaxID=690259 RepID=A0A9P5BRT8_COLSI|nr:hypothetical protein CGCSCA4_v013053 [Colletotrichum siamense]KAF4848115.1 hypothetical protein CGCSCA2_v012548 [Colletotrichum siamense]
MICQPVTTLADCANGTGNLVQNFDWDDMDFGSHTFDASLPEFPSTQLLAGGALQNLPQNVTDLPLLDNCDLPPGLQSEFCSAASVNHSPPVACSHRLDLLPFPAKIAAAIQQERPDLVLKVTREIIMSCQETFDCEKCQVTCTDLLLMMTVLQETHPCFDCVAIKDLDGDIALSFGGYQVSFNDASLRRMVVMDLVQRAATVLNAIGAKSHCMMDTLPEPCRQARANIVYLDETISHFETILERVKAYVQSGSSGL